MLIGLTGPYCAGKNLAASILEERGFEVLDVDKLGHAATLREKDRILALFGEGVRGPDGGIDRRALGERVFRDKAALASLEAIIHPAANRMAEEWLAARPGRDLCLNAALLHRMPAAARLDFVIKIRAPFFTRLFRAMKRDRLGFLSALARLRAQRGFRRALRALSRPVLVAANAGSREALGKTLDRALAAGSALAKN